MGVSENVVYPIVPNGFADHYPVFKWLAIIGNINPTFSDKPIFLCFIKPAVKSNVLSFADFGRFPMSAGRHRYCDYSPLGYEVKKNDGYIYI